MMAEFQVVNRKRKNINHRKSKLDQTLIDRIRNLKTDLKVTDFFISCINVMQNSLKVDTEKQEQSDSDLHNANVGVENDSRDTNEQGKELTEVVSELDIKEKENCIPDTILTDNASMEGVCVVKGPGIENPKDFREDLNTIKLDLVCYGLGNFSDSYIARYQLVFLLLVIEEIDIPLCNCHIFDPQFNDEEKEILQELGLNIINENEVGKRWCNKRTLFYMPHCGKALYNNLLWANWGTNLKNVVIIGNSFNSMVERVPQRILEDTGHYILKIQPYTTEKELPVTEKFEDVFNDIVILNFDYVNSRVSEDFWKDNDEPIYAECDPEIIFS